MNDEGPTVYEGAELTPDAARFWKTVDGWAIVEAAFLLNAIDPNPLNRWARAVGGRLAVRLPLQFDAVRALLWRACDAGALQFPARPADVIEWAMAKKLLLPSPLLPDGAEVHGGRWLHHTDDPLHQHEDALRLIKAAELTRDMVVADDGDDEARELVRRANEEKAKQRADEAKRIAEGRYCIDEAASAIAQQRGLNEAWARQFRDEMMRAAKERDANGKPALTVRDPWTLLPIPAERMVSMARIVTRADVNAWLDAQGTGYLWEGEGKREAAPVAGPAQLQRIKRAALIKRHANQWVSIERDLKDATTNGLKNDAKADGMGWWHEDKALAWAMARGKLKVGMAAPSVFPRTVHKLKG